MIYQKVLVQVQEFVRNYYSDHLSTNRIYHNLKLTEETLEWVQRFAKHHNLDNKGSFIVETAAWFYGTCFAEDPANHAKKDARLAERTLKEWSVPEEIVKAVRNCILASQIPQKPQNLQEQIFCDAVMFYLGQEDFSIRSKMMRQECLLLTGKKISKEVWKQRDIQLLQSHRFKTDFAKISLAGQQQKNLDDLLNPKLPLQASAEGSLARSLSGGRTNTASSSDTSDSASNRKPQNEEKKRPDRGIETMFRISSDNHQALSQMADNKAHIMITVNSIIISVLLSVLFRSLDNEPHLAIPVAILLGVNVITIVFSILATRPNIPKGNFSKQDLKEQRVNLLFFGNFYKMERDDFAVGMTSLMENRDFLYNSLINNLHEQGLVLGKKYRFLRISYNIFMYGLIAAVIAFGIAMLLNK